MNIAAYGLTEATTETSDPIGSGKTGFSGKLRSNVTAKVIDESTGLAVKHNNLGEILIKSPMVHNITLNVLRIKIIINFQ